MLDDIEVFVTVVEHGSFTAAAEHLAVSKSVISKQVSRLESRLQTRLLNRTTRRLSLTEAGELFHQRCRTGLNTLHDAMAQAASLNAEPRGLLRINSPMSFGIQHLSGWLPEFLGRYPGIDVELNLDDRLIEVIEPGFDISLRIAPLENSSLTARRLGPCHHAIVASPAYLHEHGLPQSPDALARHTILAYQYQHASLQWVLTHPDEGTRRVQVKARVSANNSMALREMVLGGAGIARMPTFLVGEDIRAGKLVRVLPEWENFSLGIYAVYPVRQFLPSKTRALLDFLQEKIGDCPAWDE